MKSITLQALHTEYPSQVVIQGLFLNSVIDAAICEPLWGGLSKRLHLATVSQRQLATGAELSL